MSREAPLLLKLLLRMTFLPARKAFHCVLPVILTACKPHLFRLPLPPP